MILAMALIMPAALIPAAPAEGIPDGPVLHLSFDTIDALKDMTGNYQAEPFGEIRVYYGVVAGEAVISLDGDGDYISLGRGFNFDGDFTVSLRVMPECADRSDAALFAKYETDHYGPYDFYLSENHPAVWVSDGEGGETKQISGTALASDEWYVLTFTYQREPSVMTVYINGIFDFSCEVPQVTANDDLVTVGRQALMFEPYDQLEYKGYMDEIIVFDRCLNEEEIQLLNMQPEE